MAELIGVPGCRPSGGWRQSEPDRIRTRRTVPGSAKTVHSGVCSFMAWVILIVSGMFEAVWAIALGKSDGFRKVVPSLIFVGALIISMGGLAIAMRTLPTGTSYAVWVAVGASLAVAYSMATGEESVSILKIVLLLGLIGCVIGLKLVH